MSVPAESPVTAPVVAETVPVAAGVADHVPPEVGSVSTMVLPAHTGVTPEIGEGAAIVENVTVTGPQPDVGVNVTVALPTLIPVTVPVEALTAK